MPGEDGVTIPAHGCGFCMAGASVRPMVGLFCATLLMSVAFLGFRCVVEVAFLKGVADSVVDVKWHSMLWGRCVGGFLAAFSCAAGGVGGMGVDGVRWVATLELSLCWSTSWMLSKLDA